MVHFLKVMVVLEVIDCRETGGVLTNMERDNLVCLLKVFQRQLRISEITTNASATIIKTVRELKETYPALCDLAHPLEVWYKIKALQTAFNTEKLVVMKVSSHR